MTANGKKNYDNSGEFSADSQWNLENSPELIFETDFGMFNIIMTLSLDPLPP